MNRSILYVQYTNPANYPPLEHSGLILQRSGWDVRYFGIQSEGDSSKLIFPETLAERVALWSHQASGPKQKQHFVAFTLAALWRAFWRSPGWVYCSDLMSCPVAWLILKLTRCKVLYHEHDSPESRCQRSDVSGQMLAVSRFQHLLLWFRREVGRKADLVVFPNAKRLELFVNECGRKKPSDVVFNCPRREEVRGAESKCLKTEGGSPKLEIANRKSQIGTGEVGELRLAFHGSINRDRLPLTVLEAMSRFPGRVHLSVVGYETVGAKGYMAEFLKAAERLGLGRTVEFLGALPRQGIFEPASQCDVGLAFMPLQVGDVNMGNMTGASNKPFDYLACGLALLVSARPDWTEMFVLPGYGRACDPFDAESIAEQLRWFLEQPVETRAMGERGRQEILNGWNYEDQLAPVLAEMCGN